MVPLLVDDVWDCVPPKVFFFPSFAFLVLSFLKLLDDWGLNFCCWYWSEALRFAAAPSSVVGKLLLLLTLLPELVASFVGEDARGDAIVQFTCLCGADIILCGSNVLTSGMGKLLDPRCGVAGWGVHDRRAHNVGMKWQ